MCVWERAQAPAFKQRRISSLPLLPSPASPSDSVELQQEAVVSKQRAGRSEVAGTFKVRSGCLPAGRGSARAAENKEWSKWAEKWCVELAPVLECSPSFAGLDKELASASLSRVRGGHVAQALSRLAAVEEFCFRSWLGGRWLLAVTASAFLASLGWAGHAPAAASSLRFVASILGHKCWIEQLADPVVKAWCSSNAKKLVQKEALPLPLHVVAGLDPGHPIMGTPML